MKQHVALLLVTGVLAASCNSQDIATDKVPAVVINALTAQFPDAVGTEWEKKDAVYEADFDRQDGTDVTVQIDASGKVLMQKKELPLTTIPAALQNGITSQYKDFNIEEVEAVEKEGTVYYQVELDGKGLKGLKDKKLVFAADGQEVTNITYWD